MAEITSGNVTVIVMDRRETEWLAAFVHETIVKAVGQAISPQLYTLAMDMDAWPDGFVTCSAWHVVAEYSTDEWDDDNGVCPECVAAGVR